MGFISLQPLCETVLILRSTERDTIKNCICSPTKIPVLYVLLTVHLGIIFVNNKLDAQFFFMYVYF